MAVILDETGIGIAIRSLAESISCDLTEDTDFAVIGIRSRGENLAHRLCEQLGEIIGRECLCGVLDITLYRDDLDLPHSDGQPSVKTTDIPFDISDKIIFLVDDVLYTGRSVRAAMDALIDFGRPKAIRLAVLVERQGREFPIQADYTAKHVELDEGEKVKVRFTETDGHDEVIIC